MSGVFRNIDPAPTPSPLSECVPPRLWCGGRTHSLGGEGVGVNSSEDARHCSVLYICKYFVDKSVHHICIFFRKLPESCESATPRIIEVER